MSDIDPLHGWQRPDESSESDALRAWRWLRPRLDDACARAVCLGPSAVVEIAAVEAALERESATRTGLLAVLYRHTGSDVPEQDTLVEKIDAVMVERAAKLYAAEGGKLMVEAQRDEAWRGLAETKARLNDMHRRAQLAESVAQPLIDGRPQGPAGRSLGRALANLGAAQQRDRADAACVEVARLRAALADAVEGMEEMRGSRAHGRVSEAHVPSFFAQKWDHAGYVERARAALREVDETDETEEEKP